MLKYCGYEIKKDITTEQLERLFNFLHTTNTPEEFIMLSQKDLNEMAAANKSEWW